MVPVSEFKVINDVTSRSNPLANEVEQTAIDFANPSLPNPDAIQIKDPLIDKLEDINQTLITLTKVINKLIK